MADSVLPPTGLIRRALIAAVALTLVSACSDSASDPIEPSGTGDTTTTAPSNTVPPTVPSTTSPSTTTDAPGSPSTAPPTTEPLDSNSLASGSGCLPDGDTLGDGFWFGFVAGAEASTVDFDLACWFTGEAAAQVASEDGQEPPPNDYYVRNQSERVRTITIPEGVQVTWYPSGDPTDERTTGFDEWLTGRVVAASGTGMDLYPFGVWITIEGGAVSAIAEQWVP